VIEDPRAYIRIAAELRRQIQDGEIKPGFPVPSIKSISQETGRARQTASKALKLLESEGFLARAPGLGYYVIKDF
jgi:DNA-binding GntR family transcriptional regulator